MVRLYQAWLESAAKKPRGIDARTMLHQLLDGPDRLDRRWATQLLLICDRELWPKEGDLRRLLALEDDEDTRERLKDFLKRYPRK